MNTEVINNAENRLLYQEKCVYLHLNLIKKFLLLTGVL